MCLSNPRPPWIYRPSRRMCRCVDIQPSRMWCHQNGYAPRIGGGVHSTHLTDSARGSDVSVKGCVACGLESLRCAKNIFDSCRTCCCERVSGLWPRPSSTQSQDRTGNGLKQLSSRNWKNILKAFAVHDGELGWGGRQRLCVK